MKKIRINELARELEVKAHEILDRLPELGVTEKKTHSSSIDEDVAIRLRRLYGQDVPDLAPESAAEREGGSVAVAEEPLEQESAIEEDRRPHIREEQGPGAPAGTHGEAAREEAHIGDASASHTTP